MTATAFPPVSATTAATRQDDRGAGAAAMTPTFAGTTGEPEPAAMTAATAAVSWVTEHFGVHLDGGPEVAALVQLALRRNPRRAHLLVSPVLGKHVPVRPAAALAAGRALGHRVAQRLAAEGATAGVGGAEIAAFGFAETATSLGFLVAETLDAAVYLHSTRRPAGVAPTWLHFQEGHSHATDHAVRPADPAAVNRCATVVLVDDELSSGTTAAAAVAALHARAPHARYVVAALVDMRPPSATDPLAALAADLGVPIEVVALARGGVHLPPDLAAAVLGRIPADPPGAARNRPAGHVSRLRAPWPNGLPAAVDAGISASDRAAVRTAAAAAAAAVRSALAPAADPARPARVLVLGLEENMSVPLLIAAALEADPAVEVWFQSTTRSPVHPVDRAGYPIRRALTFPAPDGTPGDRYLYNGFAIGDDDQPLVPDQIVVITDPASATAELDHVDGLVTGLRGWAPAVLVVSLAAGPLPLRGPAFGSYAPADVGWLLTDLSGVDLEGDVAQRESAVQAGTAHYAESLPVEFLPSADYQRLFERAVAESATRVATTVGIATEILLAERGHGAVLASLARAGTPIAILMRRWAAFRHGLTLPHYAISIVRDRGIDGQALAYLARHHDPAAVVFVDGWTGKGAIARELSAAIDGWNLNSGNAFDDRLVVLADPGHCASTFGTRDDFLIPSACLNSTVSGLVSRTVLAPDLIGPGQFHGAKFYAELAEQDVSGVFLDAVSARFADVADAVAQGADVMSRGDRTVTFAGWAALERIRLDYAIESMNFVKPGVGETTRVLLRRVPWRIVVADPDHPDHEHIRVLAADRGVPIDVRPDLPYSCVGLIRRLSA